MRRATQRLILLAIGGLAVIVTPALAAAQSGWTVDVGGERSSVTQEGVQSLWLTGRAQVGWVKPEAGGWFGTVERQTRYGLTDVAFSASGYRRLGAWTIGGGAGVTPDPSFWFRRSLDAEVSRTVAGTVVASVGVRQMTFVATTVRQVQPAVTWYHSKGELQARLFVTHNSSREDPSLTLLVVGSVQAPRWIRWSGAVARGDRIFDVGSLRTGSAPGWTVRGSARVRLAPHLAVEAGAGFAREQPAFEQRTFTLSLRGTF